MYNPNGASNVSMDLDLPVHGINNIYFNSLRAMPDMEKLNK